LIVTLTADQMRGRVPVTIDGEEYMLRFDQNALARVIDELGIEGVAGLPAAVSTLSSETLSVLVWAGRLWQDDGLALDEVRASFFPLMPTYTATIEALNLALWGTVEPEVTDDGGSDDTADPPKRKAGTSRKRAASRKRGSRSAKTSSGE